MVKLSANLGFLWKDEALPKAIRLAAKAGFDAVECHFPYEFSSGEVVAALEQTGLPMLSLNTVRGNVEAGEFGLTALKGREADARAAIDRAVSYAAEIGARKIHVMAGVNGDRTTLLENVGYAADQAQAHGLVILIEPINVHDVPSYFLNTVEQAAEIIHELGRPNVQIMFDCYHVQIMQGDLIRRFEQHLPLIGHVQVAGVPGRNEPDTGEVAYSRLLPALYSTGYEDYVGAEYVPRADVESGLGWMDSFGRDS